MSNTRNERDYPEERVPATVLVVDRDPAQLESIRRGVSLYGNRCILMSSATEALDFLERAGVDPVDILITDVTEQGSEGFALINRARKIYPRLPIIALCGLSNFEELKRVRRAGVLILRRPFLPEGLDDVIRATAW